MTSTRWCEPGTNFCPAGPTPFMRPNDWPFRQVQYGPSGPSVTYGIRSFIAADAFAVKRSGGIQGRSMWQSAEIRVYFMALLTLWASLLLEPDLFEIGRASCRERV